MTKIRRKHADNVQHIRCEDQLFFVLFLTTADDLVLLVYINLKKKIELRKRSSIKS